MRYRSKLLRYINIFITFLWRENVFLNPKLLKKRVIIRAKLVISRDEYLDMYFSYLNKNITVFKYQPVPNSVNINFC